jgi:hypothetical protein
VTSFEFRKKCRQGVDRERESVTYSFSRLSDSCSNIGLVAERHFLLLKSHSPVVFLNESTNMVRERKR